MFMAKVKKLNRKGNRGKSSRSKTRRRSEGKALEGIVKKFKESDK